MVARTSQTSTATRVRTMASLVHHVPAGQTPASFFMHLSQKHGLAFSRKVRDQDVRLYDEMEVVAAKQSCTAVCRQQSTIWRRVRSTPHLPAQPAKVPVDTEGAPPKKPGPRNAKEVERVNATAKETGLVATWHIASAYDKSTGVNGAIRANFIAGLKSKGLVHRGQEGRCKLYRPREVEIAAAELGHQRVDAWPGWVPIANP